MIHSNDSIHMNSPKWISSCPVKITCFPTSMCVKDPYSTTTTITGQSWKSPMHHISRESLSVKRRGNYLFLRPSFAESNSSEVLDVTGWGAVGAFKVEDLAGTPTQTVSFRNNRNRTPNTILGGLEEGNEFPCKHSHQPQTLIKNVFFYVAMLAKAGLTFLHPLQKAHVKTITFPLGTERKIFRCH